MWRWGKLPIYIYIYIVYIYICTHRGLNSYQYHVDVELFVFDVSDIVARLCTH